MREDGRQSFLAVEIQSLIDVLKDIRKYLQFVTQYDCDGCIIRLHASAERKYLWIFLECVIVFILCAVFSDYLLKTPGGEHVPGQRVVPSVRTQCDAPGDGKKSA